MNLVELGAGGVIIYVIWAFISGHEQPPPTLEGKETAHYEPTQYHGTAAPKDADAVVDVVDTTGRVRAKGYLDHYGIVHQDPEQEKSGEFKLVVTPQAYSNRYWFDAGAFAAYSKEGDHEAIGLRLSPCRLLYGYVAPDLLLTERSYGVGFSLYPPTRSVGGEWGHFGLELSYLRPYRDDDDGPRGFTLGLSTSTQ